MAVEKQPPSDFLKTPDGIRLRLRRWEVESPRGSCILIHGLGEHSGRYESVASYLNARRFSVWTMDHRGHGLSQGRRGDCQSVQQFVEDVGLLVQKVKTQWPTPPRILIGHSLGGLIALWYACEYPQTIQGVVASGPALKLAMPLPLWKVRLAEWLSKTIPITPIPNGIQVKDLCRDPEVVRNYEKDPLVVHTVTARCGVALRGGLARGALLAKKLQIPCLILQGAEDRICDPQGATEWMAQAHRAPVTLRRYDGLYHEVFNEPEKERVLEDLIRWLEELVP